MLLNSDCLRCFVWFLAHYCMVAKAFWVVARWFLTGPSQKNPPLSLWDFLPVLLSITSMIAKSNNYIKYGVLTETKVTMGQLCKKTPSSSAVRGSSHELLQFSVYNCALCRAHAMKTPLSFPPAPTQSPGPPVSHHPLQLSKLLRQDGPRVAVPGRGRTGSDRWATGSSSSSKLPCMLSALPQAGRMLQRGQVCHFESEAIKLCNT